MRSHLGGRDLALAQCAHGRLREEEARLPVLSVAQLVHAILFWGSQWVGFRGQQQPPTQRTVMRLPPHVRLAALTCKLNLSAGTMSEYCKKLHVFLCSRAMAGRKQRPHLSHSDLTCSLAKPESSSF